MTSQFVAHYKKCLPLKQIFKPPSLVKRPEFRSQEPSHLISRARSISEQANLKDLA